MYSQSYMVPFVPLVYISLSTSQLLGWKINTLPPFFYTLFSTMEQATCQGPWAMGLWCDLVGGRIISK